jgi:beta-lactamase class A
MRRVRREILLGAIAAGALTVSAVVGLGAVGVASALATPSRPGAASPSPTPSPTPTPTSTPKPKPKAKGGICTSAKHPQLAAKISSGIKAALAGRKDSAVGLTADDPAEDLTCAFHRTTHFYAASVIKVTILSALLRKVHGPSGLTATQRHLANLMITQSDNNAATALWNDVGMTDMQAFLNRAGMRHTILSDSWGLTQITAQDELTLLHVLTTSNKVLSKSSREYALQLMAEVIPSERWGVSAGAPSDVTVHIKNGWLPYPKATDWHINSIGAFTGKHISYQIVVLTGPATSAGQGESYGIQTVQLAADVINRILARRHGTTAPPPAQPSPAALTAPGG